ncbi:MAG: single-stranded-DNA-specific exonuclease RecJ [Clostridia bacterium]|nr:single-stranded-DNA-specific exonuclease RecJ [Clostridia bacterium]
MNRRVNKKWSIKLNPDEASIVEKISNELGVSEILASLIVNRGYKTPQDARDFITKSQEILHDPFLLNDMDVATDIILSAIANNKKITIFGDFDVDGVTSVSILYLYLQSIGANVNYYIPARLTEGYGMSCTAIDKLHKDGTNLIITVDTGVTGIEEIERANSLGIDVIVTDHHECAEVLPNAKAVINPKRKDTTYPFQHLAGVGVVFKLLCALESKRANIDVWEATKKIAYEYADLTAIGTIADVMPISDENRIIVSLGLHQTEKTNKVGLKELVEVCRNGEGKSVKNKTKKKINSTFVSYTMGPRINAAGRINLANLAVELFLEQDSERAKLLVYQLCEINRERQALENYIADMASEIVENEVPDDKSILILDHDDWHHGVVGIVSSRLTEKYGLTSILISFEGNENPNDPEAIGKGSGRSAEGMNLVVALNECADILEKYGGHELAAGLSIKRKNLPEFKVRMEAYAKKSFKGTEPEHVLEIDRELSVRDITLDLAKEISSLEPCGASNPTPLFCIKNATLIDILPVGMNRHLKLTFLKDGKSLPAMLFSVTPQEFAMSRGDEVDIAFTLEVNEFNGTCSAQMLIKDIKLSQRSAQFELLNEELYQCAKAGNSELGPDYIIPQRNDCGIIYNQLLNSSRMGKDSYRISRLLADVSKQNKDLNYVKIKFILSIFRELNIVNIDMVDEFSFNFHFSYPKIKVSLDKSNILRKLKQTYKNK